MDSGLQIAHVDVGGGPVLEVVDFLLSRAEITALDQVHRQEIEQRSVILLWNFLEAAA